MLIFFTDVDALKPSLPIENSEDNRAMKLDISYVCQEFLSLALPVRNYKIIRKINDLFYSFLWNNKGDKIKRSVMINDYDKGGLKMVGTTLFNKSLKTNWIKKIS